jgi:hypothetical protein
MLMADVMLWTLGIVGFLLAQQGLWLLCRALWPRRLAAATERCRTRPVVSFLVGLPVVAAVITCIVVAGNALGAVGQAVAFGGFILFWIYANLGTAAFATYLGERLTSPADLARPWAATIRGGVAMELAWLVPIVGWIGLLPASIVMGTGAVTLALFNRKPAIREAEATVPPPLPGVYAPAPVEIFPKEKIAEPAEALR